MRWVPVSLVTLIGAVLTTYGVWLIYPPAMFILGGVLLMAAALLHDVKPRSERDKTARRPPR